MGNFKKDLSESHIIVLRLLDWMIDSGKVAHELIGKEEQKLGDLVWYVDGEMDKPVHVEVKYDKACERTGNLCFELANTQRKTGIMSTRSDFVYYVVPSKEDLDILVFKTIALQRFLNNPTTKVRKVQGGDRNAYSLALLKRKQIENEEVVLSVYNLKKDGSWKRVK